MRKLYDPIRFDVYRQDEFDHLIFIPPSWHPAINIIIYELKDYNKDKIISAKVEDGLTKIKTKGFYIKIDFYMFEMWDLIIDYVNEKFTIIGPKGQMEFEFNKVFIAGCIEPM
jgi:hypothetical protein